ncbi:MAG: hypothetical protein EAZ91_07365 [Cytophagales bacterium]|nr:MAG: hypothetical protein EAZ91_07365 [Cytophagales bacterium]
MAATTENSTVQDPLGLQTFALSESAYDMVCSLRGIYARLRRAERRKAEPNEDQLNKWWSASQQVISDYRTLNWDDFNAVEDFIKRCSEQWGNLKDKEKPQQLVVSHAH